MGASVGRLPQEDLLEEFYRSWCSETVRAGRVRVFEELPTVFNCSVLTFGVQSSSIVNREQPEYVTVYFCQTLISTYKST
jgi:hypothetical protein